MLASQVLFKLNEIFKILLDGNLYQYPAFFRVHTSFGDRDPFSSSQDSLQENSVKLKVLLFLLRPQLISTNTTSTTYTLEYFFISIPRCDCLIFQFVLIRC